MPVIWVVALLAASFTLSAHARQDVPPPDLVYEQSILALLDQVGDTRDSDRRDDARRRLEQLWPAQPASVPSLLRAMRSDEPAIREYAAGVLGRIETARTDALPTLKDWWQTAPADRRLDLAYAICLIDAHDGQAAPELVLGLNPDYSRDPYRAERFVRHVGDALLQEVVRGLDIPRREYGVHLGATHILAEWCALSPEALASVVAEFGQANATGRRNLVAVLASVRSSYEERGREIAWPIPELLTALAEEPDAEVRAALTRVVGMLDSADSRITDALARLVMEETELRALDAAVEALAMRQETRRDAICTVIGWLQPSDPRRAIALARLPNFKERVVTDLADAALYADAASSMLALQVLEQLGSSCQFELPALARMLESEEAHIRHGALRVIAKVGPTAWPLAPRAAELARSAQDRKERGAACVAASEVMGVRKDTLELLQSCAAGLDGHEYSSLIESVRQGDQDFAIDLLLADIGVSNEPRQNMALELLCRVRPLPPRVLPVVVTSLGARENLGVLERAIEVISRFPEAADQARPMLLRRAQDKRGSIRLAALRGIRRLHLVGEDVVNVALLLLWDEDWQVREVGVKLLEAQDDPACEAIPELEKLSDDKRLEVRSAATSALASIKSRCDEDKPASSWPMFRGDGQLTGVAKGELPDKPVVRWRFRAPEAIESTAAIADGVVFVGCGDGVLYALGLPDGALKWKYATSSRILSSPTVAGGVVYFGDEDGVFHAVSADTGERRWTFKTDGEIISSANVIAGKVIFGSYDEQLYCLAAADGALLWKYPTAGRVHGSPSVAEGHVLVAGCDEMLHVVRLEDGKAVRTISLGSMSGASAAVVGSRVIVGTYGNQVVAVDWKEGKPLWTFEDKERQFPFLSSACVAEKAAVVGGRDKRVRALNAASGKLLWTFVTQGKVDSSAVMCGSRVWVGSDDGNVYAVALASGEEQWRYETGAGITASPAIADGVLVIGNLDGEVFCFGEPPKPPPKQ